MIRFVWSGSNLDLVDGLVHLAHGLEDDVAHGRGDVVQVRLSLHLIVLGAADDVVGLAWYLVNVVLVPNLVRRVRKSPKIVSKLTRKWLVGALQDALVLPGGVGDVVGGVQVVLGPFQV